jgi:sigma-B regulation protein RsbU (phosphoserine phosphatase)
MSATDNSPKEHQRDLKKRILTKFDALLAMGIFIIVGVFTATNMTKNTGSIEQITMSDSQIRQMLEKDTERINLFVKSIEKIPKEVATILELQRLRIEEIKIVLDAIMLNSSEIFGTSVAFAPDLSKGTSPSKPLYAYRKDGKVKFKFLDAPGYDYFNKDWYLLPKILGQPVWVDPYFDKGGGGVFMTTYAVPFSFFDGVTGTFTGVVTVDVSIDWLTRFFNTEKKLPDNGFVTLLSEDGTVISAPQKEWEVNHTLFSLAVFLKLPELRRVGRDLQAGKSGTTKVTSPTTGKTVKIFYAPVPANHWGILYVIPEKEQNSRPDNEGS